MNTTRMELPPMAPLRFVYPSLGKTIIDSSLTVGRTVLVGALGLSLLIGFAMLIAFGLTAGADVLGLDASGGH
jgi:hypothetical protein